MSHNVKRQVTFIFSIKAYLSKDFSSTQFLALPTREYADEAKRFFKKDMTEDIIIKDLPTKSFESEESANAANKKFNGTMGGVKQLYVCKFVKKTDRILPNLNAKYINLYFKNLDTNISEEHLREKFSRFESISSVVILKDESETSKSFEFVNFNDPGDARKAVEAMDGSFVGKSWLCDVVLILNVIAIMLFMILCGDIYSSSMLQNLVRS
ncbi:hypothetical protein BC332_00452 [Capsicum chinense]|nr:hypothetical protein BC332_00452 [Capsicum chinense]